MPEFLKINTGAATLAFWHITESEEQLKAFIGGDSFPTLSNFRDPARRLEWLATRCILKTLGITDQVLYTKQRKPLLVSGNEHISMSHTYPYAAVITNPTSFVGIDIEKKNRPFKRIAYQFLTLGELSWLNLDNTLQLALIWSAKEAFFKVYNRTGLNSFTDLDVLPFAVQKKNGAFSLLVHADTNFFKAWLEYAILDDFVITWAVCPPQLFNNTQLDPTTTI
ncbi:MAG: 4'-phosphopantetheinyl transferase family protein [Bacteroides sp.]